MVMTRVVSGRHAVPVSEPAEPEVSERATRRVFSPNACTTWIKLDAQWPMSTALSRGGYF